MPQTGMHLKQQQVIKSQSNQKHHQDHADHRSSQYREEHGEAARGPGKQRAVQDDRGARGDLRV